jgi:hypothetical protein
MHPSYDQCEQDCAQPAQTFYDPDSLRASLVNTHDSAQRRIDELEADLYAQRLLLDAARNGLETIESQQVKFPGGVRG